MPNHNHHISGDLKIGKINNFMNPNSEEHNSTNTTSNVTATSNNNNIEESIKNSLSFIGDPLNIVFPIIAIIIISSIFGVSYSKRKQ